jgi:RHS repeat-associated protein
LPDADYVPTWYEQRVGGALGAQEEDAANKAAVHTDTPSVAHADALGRTFLTVAHNKFERNGAMQEEKYATRLVFDIEGNQREVMDAKDRIVMSYDYDMLGSRTHQASMEAGERWMLNDVGGRPLYAWDSRGHQFRTAHDPLRRPTDTFLSEGISQEVLIARTVYGESQLHPETKNQRGKVVRLFDQAGAVITEDYDFKNNLLQSKRQLAREYKTILNWSAAVPLESEIYTGSTTYDALDRPIQSIAPHSYQLGAKINVIQPIYNEANLLEQVRAWLNQSAEPAGLLDPTTSNLHAVTNIDYNAKGQRVLIEYGNGVKTEYQYDRLTFRLSNLNTTRLLDQARLQHLSYTYDPASNITQIRDAAQQTIYFNNQVVTPDNDYTYDAIYRLTNAEGREHIGQTAFEFNPPDDNYRDYPFVGHQVHSNDGQALCRYTERYEYDAVGNFERMIHIATSGWTRTYDYNEPSLIEPANKKNNRLTKTTLGNGFNHIEVYTHDVHGNMIAMPHLPHMDSSFRDQLQHVDLVGGGNAYYVYDASGQRIRKVIEKNGGALIEERIYLGGFEVFRRRNGAGSVTLERETLDIRDDKQRIALVETRTQGNDGSPQVVRYQFSNHLGSASLELDGSGQIISYEEYYPYGSTSYQAVRSGLEANPKRYRYTGMERDEETGLNYHGARYYVPWLGRWAQCDPIGIADDVNLYVYARGNPIGRSDRNGRQSPDPDGYVDLGNYPELQAFVQAVHDARPELSQCAAPQIPAGPQVTYQVARSQASTGQRAFRQSIGLRGSTVQAGHTMDVDQSVDTQLPRQIRDNPATMMALHSRIDPALEVRSTNDAGQPGLAPDDFTSSVESIPWQKTNTRHTGHEGLIHQNTQRAAMRTGGTLTREGQVAASEDVLYQTSNTPWDQRNVDQILSSPRTTEAQRIEGSPDVAAYRQRQAVESEPIPSPENPEPIPSSETPASMYLMGLDYALTVNTVNSQPTIGGKVKEVAAASGRWAGLAYGAAACFEFGPWGSFICGGLGAAFGEGAVRVVLNIVTGNPYSQRPNESEQQWMNRLSCTQAVNPPSCRQ